VCGKTGSAETSNDKTVETNAWYAGFVYDDAHPYAVAVVIEQAGAGGTQAAPIAADALAKAIELD
jgi:peptidoglycan glycosyltransferase